MARRVEGTAEGLGIRPEGRAIMARAFAAAAAVRSRLDDHHPDVLHTARTALILMDDVGVTDPELLAAALVLETRDPGLVATSEALAALGPRVRSLAEAVPVPTAEGDRLLESLLATDREVTLLALAERLDHARHLHLRDRGEWEPGHALTCRAYAPLAGRTDPLLGRRFSWWCRTFQRRLTR